MDASDIENSDFETKTPERDKAGAGWVIAAYVVSLAAALAGQYYGLLFGALGQDLTLGYLLGGTIFLVGGVPALLFVGRSHQRFLIAEVVGFAGITVTLLIANLDSTWMWILPLSFATATTTAAAAWLALRCNTLRSLLWAPLVFPLSLAVSFALSKITDLNDFPLLAIGLLNPLPVVVVCVVAAIGDGAVRRNTATSPSSVGASAEQAAGFIPTIEAFVEGGQSADEFETAYLTLWDEMPRGLERDVTQILDELLFDVDMYVGDDELRGDGDGDIDAAQLHTRAAEALRKLRLLGPHVPR